MTSTHTDRDADKISRRTWSDVAAEWANYVPSLQSPWGGLEEEPHELRPLAQLTDTLTGATRHLTVEDEIPGLRQMVLHEAVANLHKSGNILRATAAEGERGYRTWCRSSAYHASLFAVRSTLGLLGVQTFWFPSKNCDFQVDIWAPRQKKIRAGIAECRYATTIIRRSTPADHKAIWGIFLRLLRVSTVDSAIWSPLHLDILKDIPPRDFAMIRNDIHYRSTGWVFPDLDSLHKTDSLIGLADDVRAATFLGDPSHHDFSPSLALYTYSLAVALLEDLARNVPAIASEVGRMHAWMAESPWRCCNALVRSGAAE